jgi:hypothetical protein
MKLLIILYAFISSVYCMEKEKDSQEFHIYTPMKNIQAHLKKYPATCWLPVALDENCFIKPNYTAGLDWRRFYLENIFSQKDEENKENESVIHKDGKIYCNVRKLLEEQQNNNALNQIITDVQQLFKNSKLTNEDEKNNTYIINYICNLKSPIELLLWQNLLRESSKKKINSNTGKYNQVLYLTQIKQYPIIRYSKKYPTIKFLTDFIPEKNIFFLTSQTANNEQNQFIGALITTYFINNNKEKPSYVYIDFLGTQNNSNRNRYCRILLSHFIVKIKERNETLTNENKINSVYFNPDSEVLKQIAAKKTPCNEKNSQDFFMNIL